MEGLMLSAIQAYVQVNANNRGAGVAMGAVVNTDNDSDSTDESKEDDDLSSIRSTPTIVPPTDVPRKKLERAAALLRSNTIGY
jgi:hypothetical protein